MSQHPTHATPELVASEDPNDAAPASRFGRVVTVLILISCVGQLVVISIAHLFVTPRFTAMFEDFDAELPVLTALWLQVPAALLMVVLLLWAVGLIVVEITVRRFLPRAVIQGVSLLLIATLTALLVFGLFLPLVALINSVTE